MRPNLAGGAVLTGDQLPPSDDALRMHKEGKVLVVERDPVLRRTLNVALYDLGFDVSDAATVREAVALCGVMRYEAVLVVEDGLGSIVAACIELRQTLPGAQLIILGSRNDREHRIKILEGGANDYLTNPPDIRELAARLRNWRRSRVWSAPEEKTIRIGEIFLDIDKRLLLRSGRQVHLTPKEYELVAYLMADAGRPKTHAQILQKIWRLDYAARWRHEENLDLLRTFIRQLRNKLERDPTKPRYLLTDRQIGYRFADPEQVNLTLQSAPTSSE